MLDVNYFPFGKRCLKIKILTRDGHGVCYPYPYVMYSVASKNDTENNSKIVLHNSDFVVLCN
jgi:hypothetical protein